MPCFLHPLRSVLQCMSMLLTLIGDALWFLWLCLHSPAALAAENLFLRKQLASYQAPNVTPRRTTHVTRCTLVWLSQWFDWQQVLTVVQPETFKRWQRQGMCRFWRWPSKPGRPPIPPELQALIRQMARDNLTWGQRRIANELRLKLGLQVSPRTVRKYMPQHLDRAPGHRVQAQRWRTFLRNHAPTLIISGMTVDLHHGVQACAARLLRRLQQWRDRFGVSEVQGTLQSDAVVMVLRRATVSAPTVWSPDTRERSSMAERSPPARGSPRNHDACTVTRATQVDTGVVRPIVAVLCGWHRVGPHSQGTRLLRHGETRVGPLRHVA